MSNKKDSFGMTIGIDIRVLARGTKTGIEEYTSNLLSFLLPLNKNINYKLFYNAFRKVKLDYNWLKLQNVELKNFRFPNRLLNFFMAIFKWPKVNKFLGDIDIFFSPHFLPIALPKKCKHIITFHDLSFKQHPKFFSFSRKIWHFLTFSRQQAKRADKIIADSNSTKEDLIKIYKIKSDKIKTIYLGVNKSFKPISKKIHSKFKTILYFGTIEPRKNLLSIIKAFEYLKRSSNPQGLEKAWKELDGVNANKIVGLFDDLKLVIAGSRGWLYKDIFKTVEISKYKHDIIFTGIIEDKDKLYLYNSANVFVYPSFFEGFGFPPLEAMACGVPTIVSNASSLPEVVGNGAIMVDPYNVDELSFAIKEILENKNLREDLIKKGLKQAKKFDWNKTAKQVLEVFKNI